MNNTHPTLQAPDNDPHLWLEDVEGAEALAWVEAQNAKTLARLTTPAFAADRDALRTIMDRPDNIPWVSRRGGLLWNFWRDAQHPKGLWRRTTIESYRTNAPTWDTLLDIDALAAAEAEDWVFQGASTLPPHHDRALLRLSRGGGDAVVLREFNLETRSFVPGGFIMPEAKTSAAWLDRDTILLSSAHGPHNATTSGYARTVRRWHRNTDPAHAPIIFETTPDNMAASAQFDRERNEVLFFTAIGFFDTEIWRGTPTGPEHRIDLPTDATVQWDRGTLALSTRTPWTINRTTHQPDTVLVIGLDAFLAGDRVFKNLFTPEPRRALQGFTWIAGRLLLSVLDNLESRHTLHSPDDDWAPHPIAGLPAIGTINAWPLDTDPQEADGTLMVSVTTPVSPTTALLIEPGQPPAILKRAPRTFEPHGAIVTRHEAISSDGERIPYIQVGPPDLTGDAPVHMTGYGGFGISMLPGYNARLGKLWLERGGTTVTANLRGGGEFGTWWHEAGRREGKTRSHDDFAAIASDLVTRGVTVPTRIAAEGGSNGGLLIANMLTRYPERFGALFCTIPLIDMRRFHKLLAGASWIAEYGNPDEPDDWQFMQHFSAYHAAEPGRPYPPILLATTRKDDRVHPGHARKMAAKLQALGYDTLFHEPGAGGHGYGRDNAEAAAFTALGMNFLRRSINWPTV